MNLWLTIYMIIWLNNMLTKWSFAMPCKSIHPSWSQQPVHNSQVIAYHMDLYLLLNFTRILSSKSPKIGLSNEALGWYMFLAFKNITYCGLVVHHMASQIFLSISVGNAWWNHFPGYWPFVRRIHRSPVNSPHKGQWRGALIFSLISAWINDGVNNREAGDLRRHRAHYDVTIMDFTPFSASGYYLQQCGLIGPIETDLNEM